MPCPIFSQYLSIQLTLVSASQDSAGLGQARRVHADRLWVHAGLCPTGSKVGLAWERMSCVGRIRRSTARTLQGASPGHTMLVPSKLCHTQWQSLLQKPLGFKMPCLCICPCFPYLSASLCIVRIMSSLFLAAHLPVPQRQGYLYQPHS